MIAHAMELYFPDAPHSYHGEQIAVTTLTMLEIIANSSTYFFEDFHDDELKKHFGEYNAKYFAEQYRAKTEKLTNKNFALDKKLFERFLAGKEALEKNLQKINCPTKPDQIGWDIKKYNELLPLVKFTRDRFTFLDLA
jgi:glycerol-1-phosphate dehydrogenase [NAD(P)+]